MISRRAWLGGMVGATALHSQTAADIRLLVVTGGHSFQEQPFQEMFRALPGIRFQHVRFGGEAEKLLNVEAAANYDAMLFYDMNQNPQPHWSSWMEVLAKGKPTPFLHHALGSYPNQPQYLDVIGGRAHFIDKIIPGEITTFWKHDEEIRVKIVGTHPITVGIDDFTIHDECYKGYYVRPDAQILLTTDHPLSERNIGWTYKFGNSPIVYLQPGHDRLAYENPSFRKLVLRSIRWLTGRL